MRRWESVCAGETAPTVTLRMSLFPPVWSEMKGKMTFCQKEGGQSYQTMAEAPRSLLVVHQGPFLILFSSVFTSMSNNIYLKWVSELCSTFFFFLSKCVPKPIAPVWHHKGQWYIFQPSPIQNVQAEGCNTHVFVYYYSIFPSIFYTHFLLH